jgi:hypothetical protein
MIRSPRTAISRSTMLTTTHTWLGITRTTSPTLGRALLRDRSRKPCSSAKAAILACGYSRMRPKPSLSPPMAQEPLCFLGRVVRCEPGQRQPARAVDGHA